MFFAAGGDGARVFELAGEAPDAVAASTEAATEGRDVFAIGHCLTLAQAPRPAGKRCGAFAERAGGAAPVVGPTLGRRGSGSVNFF